MSMYNLQRCRSTSDVVSHRLDALLFVASSSGAFPVQPTRHFSLRRVCRQCRSLCLQDGAGTADGRSRAQLEHPRDPPLGGADVVRRNGDVQRRTRFSASSARSWRRTRCSATSPTSCARSTSRTDAASWRWRLSASVRAC